MRFYIVTLALLFVSAGVEASSPPNSSEKVLPKTGSSGPRDLRSIEQYFGATVKKQPFGKKWKDIVAKGPKPKSRAGLAEAQTHPSLKFDPIELQEQSQYIAETTFHKRFGWLSLRLRQVYRYGRLTAVQIVIEPMGESKEVREGLKSDIAKLKQQWAKPLQVLGLASTHEVVFNDLKGRPLNKSWVIQLEPGSSK